MINNLKKSFYHFSVDDVFKSLIEVTDKKIGIFEHPIFLFLKRIHDEFNINVDLYLFFQKKIDGKLRTLKEVPISLKQTLNNNSWIKFGPHALDYETPPYSQTPDEQIKVFDNIYNEIYRFAGKKNISKWVRLHYFSESYELKNYFHRKGVEAILTTDKERMTTRMPSSVNKSLRLTGFAKYNGLKLIRSHIRTENLANAKIKTKNLEGLILKKMDEQNHLCFFTHEYELEREEVKLITKKLVERLYKMKIPSY